MKSAPIVLNRLDRERLTPHVEVQYASSWPILHLQRLVASARVVEPARVPPNVVTMRSCVTVHDPLWERSETYRLIYPDEADSMFPSRLWPRRRTKSAAPSAAASPRTGRAAHAGAASATGAGRAAGVAEDDSANIPDAEAVLVTSPLGAALLASHEGDEIRWISPRGPRRVIVESIVYQPERAGRFDL